ncbi:MAG: UvrD-helicase domain-containing protein [Bacillota bacterium]
MMVFLADLHLHSHFSRATSVDSRPLPLAVAAAGKGLRVIGTGDCTHAGWRAELAEALVPAEEGLYRLREAEGPAAEVRFVVSGEISCIYKQDGRTRKIHHLLLFPHLEAAASFRRALEARGANLEADGRPIVGLDSRTVLSVLLEVEPRALLIPAHIWTPHFSLFGANAGFDALEECFGDLASLVPAYETGLSSDPPMNWRLSALDRLTLVSCSDAHSPAKLGREAVEFETELSYEGLVGALRRVRGRVLGTVEFYPEEGKYHYDGHRQCGVCWHPHQTQAAGGLCPVCGRPVTVGVLHRVYLLADRPEGYRPEGAPGYVKLVPLLETVAAALDTSPTSARAQELYRRLIEELGPEIAVLRAAPLAEIARIAGMLVAEAVRRVRSGEIEFRPGYDGEYGTLTILRPEERRQILGQAGLFALPAFARRSAETLFSSPASSEIEKEVPGGKKGWSTADPLAGLDEAQRAAVTATGGPVLVVAGPGAGKTRTLVQRIRFLLMGGVAPESITAITFTHRAADEMRARLAEDKGAERVWIGTFHRFCLELLTQAKGRTPLLLDAREAEAVLAAVAREGKNGGKGLSVRRDEIGLLKSKGLRPDAPGLAPALAALYRRYQERLAEMEAYDYDDLLLATVEMLAGDPGFLAVARARARHLLVDEFQDLNPIQYRLVKALAGDGTNLFVIGDPDQAIYGFRGADAGCFYRLREDFPQTTVIRLARNYRSTGAIVRLAAVFAREGGGEAVGPAGVRPRYVAADGPRAEARAVVEEIERLIGGTGMLAADRQSGRRAGRVFSLGEIAVLFRAARQAGPIEDALLAAGIPYRLLGQRSLLAAPEVREALDLLRYVDRPSDLRFSIALREGRFDPGPEAFALIEAFARENSCPLEAAAAELLRAGRFPPPAAGRLEEFLALLADLRALASALTAEELLLRAAPGGPEGPSRALRQVARAARGRSLGEFLLRLATGQEADYEAHEEALRPGEGVNLLTMHAAKGLEFPAVILVGLAEGTVPWGEPEGEELAEERRLFYVALTRAAEVLVLIGPPPEGGKQAPSRFLAEIPSGVMEREDHRMRRPRLQIKGLFGETI